MNTQRDTDLPRLVVIGNGMAGARAVEEILARPQGQQYQITIIGAEPYGNYNRILLSHVLSGETTLESEDFFLNPLPWYEENQIQLFTGDSAVKIDRFAKTVTCASNRIIPYDVLLLATGSASHFPPMEGLREQDGTLGRQIFGFRTIHDTQGMLDCAHSREHSHVIVVGGGLLGLEAAYGLTTQGFAVTVVHSPAYLMNQQLDERGGRILRSRIESLGITVRTSAKTTAILRDNDGNVTGVKFHDGETLAADMVVVAAGIRPETELARTSGLLVERGIVVDDQLRCEDADSIYAIGECCQHRGETFGLVAPVWEHAVVFADLLTGVNPEAAYHGSRITTKLKVAGVDVAAMGVTGPERDEDEFVQFYEPRKGTYKSVVIRNGKLIGAILLGDISKIGFLSQAFDDKVPLPEERISMLFDMGTPSAQTGAEELADDAQVCNCNGVSKGTIVAAVREGATSVSEVVAQTRAGKGCGSCKGLVGDIVACVAGGALTVDPAAEYYVPCIPLTKAQLISEIKAHDVRAVSQVFAAFAPNGGDASAKMPLASLLRVIWGPDWVDERGALFINDRVHANIQKDGTFSVVPQMKGGVTTPEQLRKIADVADKYQIPMVKLTGGQRIDLLGVRKQDLPKVWGDLGMPSGYAYGKSTRTVKTCVGRDFCRFGLDDSTGLGIRIEERFQGLEAPAKLKLAVAGCPRNCSEALCKDFGVVSIGDGRWEIYVGGAAGAHIRKGDLLATVDSADDVLLIASRFIQHYRENAKWLERTYTWVPRLGIEHLRSVLVDDSEGICAGLEMRMQKSVEGYRDPWLERAEPKSPAQFQPALPLVPLPLVPIRRGDSGVS